MKKRVAVFVICLCAWCLGCLSDAFGAPSVKRLGGANTYSGTNSAVSAKSGTTKIANTGARTTSSRTNHVTSIKTEPVAKTVSGSGALNTSRLSVGKYLHNAGVSAGMIKPISGSSVTPAEMEDLTNRLNDLESQMPNKADVDALNVFYTKDEIDDKNYVTKNDADDNYVTKSEVQENYSTKSEINDTVSALDNRLRLVEDATGAGVGVANDWPVQKPGWAN